MKLTSALVALMALLPLSQVARDELVTAGPPAAILLRGQSTMTAEEASKADAWFRTATSEIFG